MKTINIHAEYGKAGKDQYGNYWTEFEVDFFAEQLPGECKECGTEIESGWMCLDGGDEVCDSHVSFTEDN